MVWSRLTSVLATVLLLFSCYVDEQEGGEVKVDLGDAGDPPKSTRMKYEYTNQSSKKRVILIIKTTYREDPPSALQSEVKNPNSSKPAEVIALTQQKILLSSGGGATHYFTGKDKSGNTYDVPLTETSDGLFHTNIPPTITTKDGSVLEGVPWDKLSEERWEKHTNPSSSPPSNVPLKANDKAELASKCYSSNASVSNNGLIFTYSYNSYMNCGKRKHTYKFSSNNLRGILNCLERCGNGLFKIKHGLVMKADCNTREVRFEYAQGGLKVTSIDDDGLTDVHYSEDC